ncbi:unconventional prefoldin RPB5 interactor 1-like [Acipenser ruthenus]|uniref:unconventional prefoldin RPB5 interactor 1-like n=1 Tax=Acipenser ruthenus TaxID=7906 RepID=UPI00145BA643|nr:unconventional prefoldin RPB5 interactor 1-like [Acipenser ruthenus]
MTERNKRKNLHPLEVSRLRDEQVKVVTGCQDQIQHWKKVQSDYEALQQRLSTLPNKLSYDIMVPFGPLAFMPGKLVHTNEVTVLLGDNWFAKCSAKQASNLVEHRKKHVKNALDDLYKVVKNFEARVGFTEDLEKLSSEKGDFVDITEEVENEEILTKGKQRTAHKPYSRPKNQDVFDTNFEGGEGDLKATSGILPEEELWARLDELEMQEELLDQKDRMSYSADTNGDDTTSSSSEEEKEHPSGNLPCLHGEEGWPPVTQEDSRLITCQVNGNGQHHSDDEDDEGSCVPTIYFTHTVEPKRVRINTGRNTTLKFSERKEEAKRKRKNSNGNGHSVPGLTKIKTPADLYRLFVDVVNGELVPRKSILKSRSREDSMCSDTSESSDDRRGFCRNLSHDESTHSDTSEGVLQEEENSPSKPLPLPGVFEAFSGTVVEKDPTLPSLIPHLTIVSPALPTIPERKAEEVVLQVQKEPCKRMSKFKAARMQQQI